MRIFTYLSFSFLLILQLAIIGCDSESDNNTMKLSEADKGRNITAAVGQPIEISLPGNPSTGYLWHVMSVDSSVIEKRGAYTFSASDDAPGSAGLITLHFAVIGTGETDLKLLYNKQPVYDSSALDSFMVMFTVNQ